MYSRILFLDFDGVLNSEQSAHWCHKRGVENGGFSPRNPEFCPYSVNNLEYILKEYPDLKIVVSSAWRLGRTVEELQELLFKYANVPKDRVIDKTKTLRNFSDDRGYEIQDWLDRNPTEKFCIVDDDSDMLHLLPKLVQTSWRGV